MSLPKARDLWRGATGVLCNDCATIELETASPGPVQCSDCARTLCSQHHWTFPGFVPGTGEVLCSECYNARAGDQPGLADAADASIGAALVPPVWLAGRGSWAAFVLFLAVIAAVPTIALTAGASSLPAVTSYWLAGAMWLGAATWIALELRRARTHRRHLTQIADYSPKWQ